MSFSLSSYSLPFEKLKENTSKLYGDFKSGAPWPHLVLDDFFDEEVLDAVLEEFAQSEAKWKTFNSKYEGKNQMNRDEEFGPVTRAVFHSLNSAPFLAFLSEITGIERLVPDPFLEGGGYHQIPKGGKLGVHVDFNRNNQLGLYRRLNIIIYLNKNWDDAYGGHFQLWDKDSRKCEKKVSPKFNRVALFETTSESFHGHPEPLNCPEGVVRRSLALYYYSPDRGNQKRHEHSTIFMTPDGKFDDLGASPGFVDRFKQDLKRIIGRN